MGFSLNVLTLLALVLAIGIVVDDAIVVLENIHRRIELGEPPLLAALRGARQIAFAVIATSLTLIAVFVPMSFMEGNVGRLFTEFGIALAASVLFSALVALSLTPMMCSKLLKAHEADGMLYRVTEPLFLAMHNGYRVLLRGTLAMPFVVARAGRRNLRRRLRAVDVASEGAHAPRGSRRGLDPGHGAGRRLAQLHARAGRAHRAGASPAGRAGPGPGRHGEHRARLRPSRPGQPGERVRAPEELGRALAHAAGHDARGDAEDHRDPGRVLQRQQPPARSASAASRRRSSS
jgi:hypothetical protein